MEDRDAIGQRVIESEQVDAMVRRVVVSVHLEIQLRSGEQAMELSPMNHIAIGNDLDPQTARAKRVKRLHAPRHHPADEQDIDIGLAHGSQCLLMPLFEQRAVPAWHMGGVTTKPFDHRPVRFVVVPHLPSTSEHWFEIRLLGPPRPGVPERLGLHRDIASRKHPDGPPTEMPDPEIVLMGASSEPTVLRQLRLELGVEPVALQTVDKHQSFVLVDPLGEHVDHREPLIQWVRSNPYRSCSARISGR